MAWWQYFVISLSSFFGTIVILNGIKPRQTRHFFEEVVPKWVKELFFAKYKIVNKQEGLYPFFLYRKGILGIWFLKDTYKQFEHARDDILALRLRNARGWRYTTTYYDRGGENVNQS